MTRPDHESIEDARKQAADTTTALKATGDAGAVAALLVERLATHDAEQLAVRTTALSAAAAYTAGMSETEARVDHDSRDHNPEKPVPDVIRLASEFEEWLQRPTPREADEVRAQRPTDDADPTSQ